MAELVIASIGQVINPAVANGYCTLAQLKDDLGITDTNDDETLDRSIAAASRQIDGHCGQRFWQDSVATARTFTPTSPLALDLLDDPDGDGISTATGLIVKLDLNDAGTYSSTLTSGTDYLLHPVNAALRTPVWPYTSIRLTGVSYMFMPSMYGRALVEITARWGWPAVPDDVTKACLIQATDLFKSKDAPFGMAGASDMGVLRVSAGLNRIATSLLAPYRRPAVG